MNGPITQINSRTVKKRRLRSNRQGQESGIALVIVIVALLLITAVAAGMIVYSNSEATVDNNYRDSQVALYAA